MTRPSFFCVALRQGGHVHSLPVARHRPGASADRRVDRREGRFARLVAGVGLFDAHAQVVPGRLAGDRIGIRPAHAVAAARGSSSLIRWLSRKPFVASGASGDSAQAPLRLPMAFQVQTVWPLTASMRATGTLIRPWCEVSQTQSPSLQPVLVADRRREHRAGCWPWICRSQAFCEPQAWYIAAGRWVMACSGKPSDQLAFEGRIPDRQRIEAFGDALAQMVGRLLLAEALRRRAGTCAAAPDRAGRRNGVGASKKPMPTAQSW